MKKIGLVAVLFLATHLGFAQHKQNVGVFNSVEVTDKIQVELIKGESNEVVFEGVNSENIQVINKNGALRIKMGGLNALQGAEVSAKVYYQSLKDISAKKGAKVISRSSEVIHADLLSVGAAEGGLVDIYVDAKKLNVKPTSGSTIAISGQATTQDVVSNLGGKYEGKNLISDISNVTVNGGGAAQVFVKSTVVAKTRAGGVIDIYGSPAEKSEKKMLGGVINYK